MQTEIRDAFVQHLTVTKPHLQDQIKAIVLTKGVPTRVSNSGGSGTNNNDVVMLLRYVIQSDGRE